MPQPINTILHGDCLELMNQIEDHSIELILADLPFGVLNRKRSTWDNVIPMEPLWNQYRRIIKPGGTIALFGMGLFSARLMLAGESMFKYSLVWVKNQATGFLNAKRQPLRQHEDILIFQSKGATPTYNPQKTTGHKPAGHGTNKGTKNYGHFKTEYDDIYTGSTERFPRSVIYYDVVSGGDKLKAHSTQKPCSLGEMLIKTYTNEGDTVLDNCCGSGAFLRAAKDCGRNWIGIEKEEIYWSHATKWLSE